jgi:hypothetical protein
LDHVLSRDGFIEQLLSECCHFLIRYRNSMSLGAAWELSFVGLGAALGITEKQVMGLLYARASSVLIPQTSNKF